MKKENFEDKIVCGDASKVLLRIPEKSVDLVVTSPPYFGCREYDSDSDGLGREADPREYVKNLSHILQRLWPVLKDTGSLYLNLGDVYFGTKGFSRNEGKWARRTDHQYKDYKIVKEDGKYLQHKQRLLLPQRVAIELQNNGWILRNNIIWEKPNPLPCHARDRRLPVYENIFHFVKQRKYYFNLEKSKELLHHRDVIKCAIEPYRDHVATFPEKLIGPFIQISCPENGVVLDPFLGGGTTAKVASELDRHFIGIELSYQYCLISKKRLEEPDMFSRQKKVDIVIRKTAPSHYVCSKCKESKGTTPRNYWKRFLKGNYEDPKEMEENYVCMSCRK